VEYPPEIAFQPHGSQNNETSPSRECVDTPTVSSSAAAACDFIVEMVAEGDLDRSIDEIESFPVVSLESFS
jgi:hypothetical protein